MKKVITGTIHQGDFDSLKQIMRDQSLCHRYAYQRIHKDGLSKSNDVVKACKPLYMNKLNPNRQCFCFTDWALSMASWMYRYSKTQCRTCIQAQRNTSKKKKKKKLHSPE